MYGNENAASATEPGRDVRQVPCALQELSSCLADAERALAELENRLDGALRHEAEKLDRNGAATPKAIKAPLANAIDEQTDRVRMLGRRIAELIGRVEI